MFGRGLEDDRYVVERFQAMADGDIRRIRGEESAKRKGRKAKRTVATRKAVQQMRPARTEIIICTSLRIKSSVQLWGDIATGPFSLAETGRYDADLRNLSLWAVAPALAGVLAGEWLRRRMSTARFRTWLLAALAAVGAKLALFG